MTGSEFKSKINLKQIVSKVEPINKLQTSTVTENKRKSSALSLKSLMQKREETAVESKFEINTDDLPRNPFQKQELLDLWNAYIAILNKKGEKLLASLMSSNQPEINLTKLTFSLPNSRMKNSLLKAKPQILKYLREQLQNYQIDFKIIINEAMEKKFAYTPKEKYEVLREKNPLLSKLKKIFDLDV